MKHKLALLALVVVFTISLFLNQTAYAQSSSVSNNVTLQHLNVQLTYPAQVLPTQSITVNLQAKAKDSFRLNTLTLQVYLANSSGLRQLTSATLAQDQSMTTGGQINKDVQVTVPADAPRTSLVAVVSESVRMTYYYYTYGAPYWYGYENYSWPYFWAYPSYYYRTVTDNAIAPLTYIKATTPEYVTLQSQYQQLQQMLNQTQAQNKDLQQNLQSAQNTIAQRDSTITGLNGQLASLQSTITLLKVVVVILAVAFVVAAVVAFVTRRGKAGVQKEPEEAEIKKE
jgi:peptidoglycan hydrolase CwlO-like protein